MARGEVAVEVRAARPSEADRLTTIAHEAKRHWGYPEELISLWRADLTVTPEFIAGHPVFCAAEGPDVLGFYALVQEGTTFELEHMWVDPRHIGSRIGGRLFRHAVQTVRALGGSALNIASDPNAEGFYVQMGAIRMGEVPSKPEGRTLPLLRLVVENR